LDTCVDKYETIINENQNLKERIIELETENRMFREQSERSINAVE